MASNTGNPFSQCLCCIECQENAKDFQKIIDLKNIGLVIYRHITEIHDKNMKTDEAAKVTEEKFIIENTKDQEITSAQYLPEIEQNQISCLRCRKIFEHAQRLLQTIPNLDKNDVRGICDHCLMEQKSCNECEQVIQKFLSKAKELPENTKNFIKQWLTKVKNVFKSIDVDDDIIKDFKLEKPRTKCDLYVDRSLIKSPKQPRQRYVKQLFIPQIPSTQKTVTDDRIVSLKKGQAADHAIPKTHLKEKRLRIDSPPQVPMTSKEELLEGSFEDVEPSTRPKSSHYTNIMKPDDMDHLFETANKKNRESLRKYHSDESLLTIAEIISKTDAKMRKDFSYFFPKKEKLVYPKRFASSFELIKETQDILQEKAEAERKKREIKALRKLNIQAKKEKARSERKAYHEGKLRDKEKFSNEPHRKEDGTIRHLTTPIGQSDQKQEPATMIDGRELSSATVGGVYKKDDKSHKIKGIAPSKTANFETDKEETTHIVKGERYAKGATSKGKTVDAKTDRQKDIREDQKLQEKTEKGKSKKEYEEKVQQGKEQKHREKDEKEKSGKGKEVERPPKEQKQRNKEEKEQSGKGKVDERAPKEQRRSDKIEREKPDKGKENERTSKEQRQKDKEEREKPFKGKENERTPKEQTQRDKEEREKSGKGKVDERMPKEQKQKDKEEREKSGKGKVDESISKEQKQKDKEEKEKSGKGKVDESTPKEQKQKDKEEREKIGKGRKDESTPKDQTQRDKEEKEKSDKGKVEERPSKEQKQKEDKMKSLGQQKEIEQKTKDKKGEEKQLQPDRIQKETITKPTETPSKDKKQKDEKENTKQNKEKVEKGDSTKDKQQQSKQGNVKEGKEKITTEKEEELNQEAPKIQRDPRETKQTISSKAQEALLGLGQEKQKKEKETKQENDQNEKNAAEPTKKQKYEKLQRNQDIKETTSKREEEFPQETTKKIERDAREAKDAISAKAEEALLGLIGQNKQQRLREPKQERDKKEKRDSKSGTGKNKKSKKSKSPKKKKVSKEEIETPSSDDEIAPKSKHAKRKFEQATDSEEMDLAIDKIKLRRGSPDDLILRLVRLKQTGLRTEKPKELVALKALGKKLRRDHKPHNSLNKKCIMCLESDLEFDLDSLFYKKKVPKYEEIIIGPKIYKYTPPLFEETTMDIEPSAIPLLYTSNFVQDGNIDPITMMRPPPSAEIAPKAKDDAQKISRKNDSQLKKTGKQPKVSTASAELETSKGITHYTLSDRSFIEKGWTMLPTEKVVRKMNVYRMRPAQPEFDWFQHNKNKGQMSYDTGEVLAEFDDNGRGRWFYRNGRLALDYYDAEELNAGQRFVIWSSGEPDERGRTQPYTILATFDYLGNGIVFDHSGKIRLKYNQTEGIVLDRKIGPVSHWKWHTLNDPPVLQQVMIDTHMAHKDQNILQLGGAGDDKSRPDNDDMLAIEFDNFIKEKSKKLTQSFKPFQIKMKALKINENFSLRVMDQASVYLIYRDGTTNLKLNIGMILDHKEIVDTDTAEVGEVSNNIERLPAKTDSLAGLQKSVAYAQCFDRIRSAREKRLRLPQSVASADKMTAAASRPLRPPLRSIPSDSSTTATRTGYSCSRKPTKSNIYYDNRLF